MEDDFDQNKEQIPAAKESLLSGFVGPAVEHHLVIMLSGKAAKHLKLKPSAIPQTEDLEAEAHWLSCWRCEHLAIQEGSGIHFFIFTNARTLYSLIIPNKGGNPELLVNEFARILFMQLAASDIAVPANPIGTYIFVRGRAPSLIGSQTELIRCVLDELHRPDATLDSASKALNGTPMMAISEIFPEEAFRKALAVDPPFPPPSGPADNIVPFSSLN